MQLLLTVINWTHRPRCSYRVVSYVPRRAYIPQLLYVIMALKPLLERKSVSLLTIHIPI